MSRQPPDPRLQRTPSAAPPSPLSRQSLGAPSKAWRKGLWIIVAPVLGLMAMILPVLLRRPARWYDSPLFPVIRNAQEHLGVWQLVLFFLVGVVLGLLFSSRALLLGGAAVILFPLAGFAEMVADSTSHNLWPFEFMFYASYGAIVAAGAALAHRAARRFTGQTSVA